MGLSFWLHHFLIIHYFYQSTFFIEITLIGGDLRQTHTDTLRKLSHAINRFLSAVKIENSEAVLSSTHNL